VQSGTQQQYTAVPPPEDMAAPATGMPPPPPAQPMPSAGQNQGPLPPPMQLMQPMQPEGAADGRGPAPALAPRPPPAAAHSFAFQPPAAAPPGPDQTTQLQPGRWGGAARASGGEAPQQAPGQLEFSFAPGPDAYRVSMARVASGGGRAEGEGDGADTRGAGRPAALPSDFPSLAAAGPGSRFLGFQLPAAGEGSMG
jgi:hypothetical protein